MANICLVSSQYLPHVGGVENYVYNLSSTLVGMGHSVTVVTSSFEGCTNRSTVDGVEIYRMPSFMFMNGRFPFLRPSGELRRFKRLMKERHFDLVLINMRFFPISLTFTRLAKKYAKRCVILDHGSSHLNTGGRLTTKLSEIFEHTLTFFEKLYRPEFAGVSKESLLWLTHFGIKTDILLCNAVDPEKFGSYLRSPTVNYREKLSIGSDARVISFVGRLTVEKGVRELVGAFERLSSERDDVYLILAGDGYLKSQINELSNDKIITLGNISSPDVAALLSVSDVFCLPSYSEGFPTCVLEASLARVFTVTTKKGDAKEIIKSENEGIILESADEEKVYTSLVSVIDREEYRKAAAERCYRTVINNYTWKHTAKALLSLIREDDKR